MASKSSAGEANFPVPKPLKDHGPARIIALCNQKGGVGKTTSTVSLAASLAEYGRRVLVVDFDPQGSLTVGMTGNQLIEPTMYEVMMGRLKSLDVLVKTRVPGVDLLPAGIAVIDDPLRRRGLRSRPFDGEGLACAARRR